jgi:hypothetical protein
MDEKCGDLVVVVHGCEIWCACGDGAWIRKRGVFVVMLHGREIMVI